MTDPERTIEAYRQKDISEVKGQATTAKADIRRQAAERQAEVSRERGQVEKELQSALGKLRTYKRQQQRKMVIGKGGVVQTKAATTAYQREADRLQGQLKTLQSKIATAEASALKDIDTQVNSIVADIDKAYNQQLTDWKASNIKLATGEWIDKTTFSQLSSEAKAVLLSSGISGYKSWAYSKAKAEATVDTSQYHKLATGEYVLKTEYDKLSVFDKKIINQRGVEGFGKALEQRAQATLKVLDTGEVMSRRDYNALNAEQKKFINQYGIDRFNRYYTALARIEAHPDQFFYNPDTGKWGIYELKSTALGVVPVKGTIFGIPVAPSFEAGLSAIGNYFLPEPEETQGSYWDRFKGVASNYAPVYSTIKRWENASDVEKGILIATDLLFFYPVFKGGTQIVKNVVKNAKGINATAIIKSINAQEFGLAEDMAKGIRLSGFGKTASVEFINVSKAQAKYFEALAKLDKALNAKVYNANKVLLARQAVERAKQVFRTKIDKYITSLKNSKTGKMAFDSPTVRSMYDNFSDDLIRQTDDIFDSIKMQAGKANISELKQAVTKARQALESAKSRFPADPSKWTDLVQNLNKAELKLASALGQDAVKLHNELVRLNELIAKETNPTKLALLIARRNKTLALISKDLKNMEGIYGTRTSYVSQWKNYVDVSKASTKQPEYPTAGVSKPRGMKSTVVTERVQVAEPYKVLETVPVTEKYGKIPRTKPVAPTVTVPKQGTSLAATTISQTGKVLVPKTAEEVFTEAITQIATSAVPITKSIAKAALEQAIRLQVAGYTKAQMASQIETYIKAQVAPATLTKTQLKQAVKQAVKVAVKVKAGYRRPIPMIPDKSESGKSRPMTPAELQGAVGWKQGIMYKMIYPPYGESNIVNSREPIAGIKYHVGAKSAYRSLVQVSRGTLPPRILRDMGIMDIEIERGHRTLSGRSTKPTMRFRRDVRRRTQTTPRVGYIR